MSDSENTSIKRPVFDIRYVKLHFSVEFTEDTTAPKYKASALRGGMGEMLLRANCVRDRQCENCDFESECLVRRIMYSKMEIQPAFMSAGDSVGYVFECEDYHETFRAGDRMEFSLLLFGKTICYFGLIINALYALGMNGLGKEKSRFAIVSITNTKKQPIMDGSDINMNRYIITTIADYISYRKKQVSEADRSIRLKFQSPTTIKYRQNELDHFDIQAIVEAACRRIYMLDCFEGIESQLIDREFLENLPVPETVREDHRTVSVKRYSNHKKSAMYLSGIEGEIELNTVGDDLIDILLAGELIHIGKNTSFGFGRYRVMQ